MLHILRAFAWLRWRILLNSLERHGGRDTLERFSLAIEQLAPLIVAVVMIPSLVGLAAAGAYAGWSLAQPEPSVMVLEFLRFALLGGCVFALVGPILLPTGDRTNAVRLLLLPIPRAVLYLAQMMSMLADPWMLLMAAVISAIPAGLLAGGAIAAGAIAALAGILLLVVLAGLGLGVTAAVHLAVRDRRRGEILTLLLLMGLPLLGMLPGVMDADSRRPKPGTTTESRERETPGWWTTFERRALAIVPSEMYVKALRNAAGADVAAVNAPLLALAGGALLLHGAAFAGFARLLNSPASLGSVRARTGAARAAWRIPGVSAGTSAVAINQLRLGFRTPRGRSTLLSPLVMFGVFALLMSRSGARANFAFIPLEGGIGLAAFTAFFALLCLLPLAMNQFAIDRAGLTLALLVPLDPRALLVGKAIGNALIAAMPAAVCIAGAMILFPEGDPRVWVCVPLSMIGTYVLVAPIAAMLSAIFPRAVDLNSIGQGSNAHGAAGLLGTAAFLVAGAPGLLLTVVATKGLNRPALAPVFVVVFVACAAGISVLLFRVAHNLFERRRENLGLIA